MTIEVLPIVELKDVEGAAKAIKDKKFSIEAILEKYDVTEEQLKILKDETV